MSPAPRLVVAQHWFLMLDGKPCGYLTSFSGGTPTADVVPDAGATPFVRKHLGPAHYELITLKFGVAMGTELYAWISAALAGKQASKKGTVLGVGAGGKAATALDFEGAVIVETTLPRLDAALKAPAAIELTIAPKRTQQRKPTESVPALQPTKQKLWLASNFRLDIPGLDCSRVSAIEPLTVPARTPVDFPPLRLSLAAVSQPLWAAWLDEFVVKGLNDDAHEKAGSIAYLAPDQKEQLGLLQLFNLGIFRLAPEPAEPAPNAAPRVVAELYCERMELGI